MYSFCCFFPTCSTRIPPLSPCYVHAWHCPSAPRMPLDPLRAVGAVQVGAAVGAEVVAGLYVDHLASAHGALFFLACGHPPCSGSASYYSFWQARYPWQRPSSPRAPAPGSPPACLDRRRTLPPRLRGAAELKFAPSKCRPPPQFAHIDENDPRLNNVGWNGRGRIQNKSYTLCGFRQTR